MKFLVLCLLLAAWTCLARESGNSTYTTFYNSLPDELKYPFIKYQLALGIFEEFSRSKARGHHFTDDLLSPEGLGVPENIFSDLQKLPTPHGYSEHLYEMVTEDYGLGFDEIISLIKESSICLTSGCWDLGDVGSNCC